MFGREYIDGIFNENSLKYECKMCTERENVRIYSREKEDIERKRKSLPGPLSWRAH